MSIIRRFLIAPSLARLIRKERGSAKVTEGYFAPQATRVCFVLAEETECHLVLSTTDGERRTTEERTEVPRAHGDALLDVCNGKIDVERTVVRLDGRDALIDRYLSPAGLDTVSVVFEDIAAARAFGPPIWFGDEVSDETAFEPAAVAIDGVPVRRDATPSNATLDAVLDFLERPQGLGRQTRPRLAA